MNDRKDKPLNLLLSILKTQPKKLGVSLVLMIVGMVFVLVLPLLEQTIIDKAILQNNRKLLIYLVAMMISIKVTQEGLSYFLSINVQAFQLEIGKSLSKEALKHSLKLDNEVLKQKSFGNIFQNELHNIAIIQSMGVELLLSLLVEMMKMVGGIIGLVLISWKLALFLCLVIPLKLLVLRFFKSRIVDTSIRELTINDAQNEFFDSIMRVVMDIKLFNLFKKTNERFNEIKDREVSTQLEAVRLSEKSVKLDSLTQNVIFSLLYLVGGGMIFRKTLSVGSLVTFITYSAYFTMPLQLMTTLLTVFQKTKPALISHQEFNLLPEEPLEIGMAIAKNSLAVGVIEARDLSFTIDDRIVFEKLNFCISEGEKIAILGENGAGKSTLLRILLRLETNYGGVILLNQEDVTGYNLTEYRSLFSVVNQEPLLFNGSIKDNLTLFDSHKLVDSILENFSENILFYQNKIKFPLGLDTLITKNGKSLSGGEKQKLAFLRAILSDSKIIILDEMTSNLDSASIKEVYEYILTKENRTTIMVTHDNSNISSFDQVLCLK